MNRLYQPELKDYQQSLDTLLKGQDLYPMEGNYLDTSMSLEHIGPGVKATLKEREKQNNQNLFGDRDRGRFKESSTRAARVGRDIKELFSGMVKPD